MPKYRRNERFGAQSASAPWDFSYLEHASDKTGEPWRTEQSLYAPLLKKISGHTTHTHTQNDHFGSLIFSAGPKMPPCFLSSPAGEVHARQGSRLDHWPIRLLVHHVGLHENHTARRQGTHKSRSVSLPRSFFLSTLFSSGPVPSTVSLRYTPPPRAADQFQRWFRQRLLASLLRVAGETTVRL